MRISDWSSDVRPCTKPPLRATPHSTLPVRYCWRGPVSCSLPFSSLPESFNLLKILHRLPVVFLQSKHNRPARTPQVLDDFSTAAQCPRCFYRPRFQTEEKRKSAVSGK